MDSELTQQHGENAPSTTPSKPLIYHAEDDPFIRDTIKDFLESQKIASLSDGSLISFEEGTSALAAMQERLPDILITDNRMTTDVTGIQLTMEALRLADQQRRRIGILYVSGTPEDVRENKDIGRILMEGRALFVQKPFLAQQIIGSVRMLLELNRLPFKDRAVSKPSSPSTSA